MKPTQESIESAKGGEWDCKKELNDLGMLPKRRIEISPNGHGHAFMICKSDSDAIESMIADVKEGEIMVWRVRKRMMTDKEYNELPEHSGW